MMVLCEYRQLVFEIGWSCKKGLIIIEYEMALTIHTHTNTPELI